MYVDICTVIESCTESKTLELVEYVPCTMVHCEVILLGIRYASIGLKPKIIMFATHARLL